MTPREEQNRAKTQAELERLARVRGYSNPKWWAMQVLSARAKKQAKTKALTFKGERV